MSFTLLGVYAVFRQALLAEDVVSSRWRNRAAAVAVVDHLAEAVGGVVILPDLSPFTGGPGPTADSLEFQCLFGGSMPPEGNPSRAAIEHRRYQWALQGNHAGRLLKQGVLMAGTTDLVPNNEGPGAADARRWDSVPQIVVAENIDKLDISYRPLSRPDSNWRSEWRDPEEPVLIRIRATVSGYLVERYVAQRVNAKFVDSDQGESS